MDARRLQEEWSALLARLRQEVASLDSQERAWMARSLAAIELIQREMHACAAGAGSEEVCADCVEVCCDRGKNHATLVNLLFYLLEGSEPPPVDFAAPCPQLGPAGCLFPPERRPFNCVTFNCHAVEERMSPAAKERFYTLEPALRALYEAFSRRYAGAGLQGVLIRAGRLKDRPWLGPATD